MNLVSHGVFSIDTMLSFMKFFITAFFILLHLSLSANLPSEYYAGTSNFFGYELEQSLYAIIKGHQTFPYTSSATDVWDILKESDRDPNNAENVILVYTGKSVNAAQEYNSNSGWSREHVWAKSHGDFGTDKGAGTDLHHLKPADISVNSARNNKDFDDGGMPYFDDGGTLSTLCFSDTYTWEPCDAVKGDIARMIFYMAVRYNGEDGEPQLSILDDVNTFALCDNDEHIGYMGRLSTLLEWHAQDPVDSFEYRRNEVIYSYQHNRNPFIDYPEFAHAIWDVVTPLNEKKAFAFPKVKVYHHEVQIFPQGTEIQRLLVYSSTGVLINSKHHVIDALDISVKPGIYLLVVENANQRTTQKIVVP